MKHFVYLFLLFIAWQSTAVAQQTAVISVAEGNKVYLRVDGLSLRSDLDTLFGNLQALQDQIDALSWADVLENGTTPGVDVNFYGYDATGIGQVTTTGTFTGDSLILNKDAAISGRLDVSNVTTLGDSLIVAGTVVLNDSLRVVEAVSFGSRLHVTGVTAFGDSVHVVGNVDLDALFNVDGAATFGSTVNVSGETTLSDTLHVDGATLLNDSLNVDGNTYLEQDLQVDGNTNIGGTTNITGAVTLGDALSVSGKTSLGDSLLVTGGAQFDSGVNVDGSTTLNAVTMDGDLDLNGNADISGTLDVHGATTLADSLTVEGATTLNDTLKVNAPALMNDSLHVAGGSSFGSNVTVDGATSLGSTLNVTGNTSLGGTLGVTGVTSLGDSLHVTGGADFDGNVNVDGNTTLNTATVSGTTTLQGELTANAEATFNDTVHFNKPALFADSADFATNVNVGGTMSVSQLIIDGVTIPALDNTDALPEGDSNLYFTADREAALQSQIDFNDSVNTALNSLVDNLLNQLFDPPVATTTASATGIGETSATIHASIDAGGADIDSAGFMVSTSSTLANATLYPVIPAEGSTTMSKTLTGLTSDETYYFKAYIATIMGTSIGDRENFSTVGVPYAVTSAASTVEQSTATLNANVADDGGATVTSVVFEISTSTSFPSGSTTTIPATSGTGLKSVSATGLAWGTKYYFRVKATNSVGTYTSSRTDFTTIDACDNETSITYNSVTYGIKGYGQKCWFTQGLRSSTFRNNVSIPTGLSISGWQTTSNPAYDTGNFSSASGSGYLYNHFAVRSSNQICPTGWGVPTRADVVALDSNVDYLNKETLNPVISPQNRSGSTGTVYSTSPSTEFWTSTAEPDITDYYFYGNLSNMSDYVIEAYSSGQSWGKYVRCVKN